MDIVQCSPHGVDDWRCSDHHISEPLSACQAVVAANRIAVGRVIVARAIQLHDCAETAPPTPYNVVSDGTKLVAIRENATDREMRMSASVAGMLDPSTSPWGWLVNWLRGIDGQGHMRTAGVNLRGGDYDCPCRPIGTEPAQGER